MNNRPKVYLIGLTAIFVVLLGLELYLRFVWGFCDAVLMQTDPDFEYIAQPNQDRTRFKRHIRYNSYNQRNEEVDSTAFIILGLGDSVINGGAMTDQDSLATTILSETLSSPGKKVQVLNISAGSWGPDNCMAYLKRYGSFQAKAAFLVCSSHDVHDTMNFTPVVDADVSYPSGQYSLACWELMDRYLKPRIYALLHIQVSRTEVDRVSVIQKPGKEFNPGFQDLADFMKERNIPFFLLLHAEASEQQAGEYSKEGQSIINFCNEQGIPVLQDLGKLSLHDYRDAIHLNEQGQKKMASICLQENQCRLPDFPSTKQPLYGSSEQSPENR